MTYTSEKEHLKELLKKKSFEVHEEIDTFIKFKRGTFFEVSFSEEDLQSLKRYVEKKKNTKI